MGKRKLDARLSKAKKGPFYFVCAGREPDSFQEMYLMDFMEGDQNEDFFTAFELFRKKVGSSINLSYVEFGGKLNRGKRAEIVNFISKNLGVGYNINWVRS